MQSQQGMYVSNRDVTVSTTTGHVIQFKKNVPIYVPEPVRQILPGYGILPIEGEIEVGGEKVEVKPPPPTGLRRDEQIYQAIKQLIGSNNPDDFTAGGIPSKKAIEKITGFEVNVAERNAAWKRSRRE